MAPPPRRNPQQNPTRRKVRVRARTTQRCPCPRHQFRKHPNSLVYSLLSQGEEPWLAASLRPANFLPGLAIGFLLGVLLDLSSSWRPKSSPAPAPAAASARGSSSKRASGSSFASGGEELKMVGCFASVLREYTWWEFFVAASSVRGALCVGCRLRLIDFTPKPEIPPFTCALSLSIQFYYKDLGRWPSDFCLIIAALFELHNSRVELALIDVNAICRF
jgi:PTH2 family peptidyl-tRNA hydrolase